MKAAQAGITDTLNELIEVHNDRIEGYETAAKETTEVDLKNLFTSMSGNSSRMKNELAGLVKSHGGEVKEGTSGSGKLYRAWMDIKAAVTGKNRKAILGSCVFGEESALKSYDQSLEHQDLPPNIRTILLNQRTVMQDDYNKVVHLRDAEK